MKTIYTLITCCSLMAHSHAVTLDVVKDGKPTKYAYNKGKAWKSTSGNYLGNKGSTLSFNQITLADEFTVTATLSLEKLQHTAAGIYIGSEYFGFDGKSGLFTEGGSFGGFKSLGHTDSITAEKPFTFKAKCENDVIRFYIDNKLVTKKKYTADKVGSITLRPHRNTMRVRDFSVTGEFEKPRELNHLFACGNEGYASYRIPAMVTTTKGTLLAFSEGRKHHSHDHGDIDIVLKRSTDNGKTWSKLNVVFDNGNVVAGNPVPIVDKKTGRIYLVTCTSDHHEYSIYQGKGRRGIHIQHSDNDGKSWSKPRDISKGIYPENWRWYATGPCSGIQIQEGKYAGRLVVPANHTIVEEEGTNKNVFRAHSIYSDDNGKTWQLGEPSAPGGNESSIAEVSKKLLIQSIRMQSHRKGMRGIRFSKDGGETWSELEHDYNLPCPMCQGAVIRDYSESGKLIHSNPGTGKGRTGMTVRISDNKGKSWSKSKTILNSSSAYSDMSLTKDGKIAILYEGGHFDYAKEGIIFELVDPDSLKK